MLVPDDGTTVTFTFDGRQIHARYGESVGAALWAAGIRRFRDTRRGGRPRAIYCGIGHCFDCLVQLSGGPPVRACITPVAAGLDVRPASGNAAYGRGADAR